MTEIDIYLAAVVLLFTFAVIDLVVGVSNDAVNFLNSAVGARVAPRWGIMLVASSGIFIGASFSSGMMEVARKGVFNPHMLTFSDIMVIFLAVMLTDIVLLDLFNTAGMPTSTTVSIVFELLGATVFVSLLKTAGESGVSLGQYVNGANAARIISGIFLAVGIAFTVGTVAQFASRLLFTFRDDRRKSGIVVVWSAVALTTMVLFLLVRGLQGASFFQHGGVLARMYEAWWHERPMATTGLVTAVSLALVLLLDRCGVNVLRVTVLVGTFSLAMAFAGNDLVNFIGVPVAGFQAYKVWSASGEDAAAFDMGSLAQQVPTEPLLLVLAGAVMVATLWVSKKARSVTETEVNLGRQSVGYERFKPNLLARVVTRFALWLGRSFHAYVPKSIRRWVERNYEQPKGREIISGGKNAPAFDLVRASVNLTVASVLIALATSYKMPLSTTYVSFMVAMGASLADRAWGRESAVYRVSGVLQVIGGWFITAAIAFCVAGVFAVVIRFGGIAGVLAITALAGWTIYHTFRFHGSREREKQARQVEISFDEADAESLRRSWSLRRETILSSCGDVLERVISGLGANDRARLKDAMRDMRSIDAEHRHAGSALVRWLGGEETDAGGKAQVLDAYACEAAVMEETRAICACCETYLENLHTPITGELAEALRGSVARTAARLRSLAASHDGSAQEMVSPETSAEVRGSRPGEATNRQSWERQMQLAIEVDRRLLAAAQAAEQFHRATK